MVSLTRRSLLRIALAPPLMGRPASVQISRIHKSADGVSAQGDRYSFEWFATHDRFRLADKEGRTVVAGRLQPAVIVQPLGNRFGRRCISGRVAGWDVSGDTFAVDYEEVNNSRRLRLSLRFDGGGVWMEPVAYECGDEDVVAVHYFGEGDGTAAQPALQATHWVLPGLSESSGIGPLVQAEAGVSGVIWRGRGATGEPGILQQWGLPAHYFCGFTRDSDGINRKDAIRRRLSDSFCCGLAELPLADMLLDVRGGRAALIFSYRGDLWGQCRGPSPLTLGGTLYFTVGANYYEAVRSYYLGLVKAGLVRRKEAPPSKVASMLATQFNSWGAQVAMSAEGGRFDSAAFEEIYEGLLNSGMKAGMFVFDDKWEGIYGGLTHSAERFPDFEKILSRIRADGRKVGMWAAFLRIEKPEDLGLTTSHVLRKPDGAPYQTGGAVKYYLLDFTQPEVQLALRDLARRFIRRYQPDLVKFDFGYELPSLSVAAPKDKTLAGEKLFHKGVEIVVRAMREEKPDIVCMYYSLSPLFIDYLDLHSPDDLFLCQGEYDLEANRRFFFSSLLGELGMPTYGSGGYDWETMPSIWFDSAAVGTLGSLLAFSGDEKGQRAKPEWVAKFNGVAQALRPSATFSIEPYESDWLGPARGARSSSWVRREDGKVVLIALRKQRLDGRAGSGKYRDLLDTTASVIVSSKSGEDITQAGRLAVVPYGDGEITVKRTVPTAAARVVTHLFGGAKRKSSAEILDGSWRLRFRETAENGTPVEWIEVSF